MRHAAEQTDIAYQEVKDVVTVGRGVGLWGDMVSWATRHGEETGRGKGNMFQEYICDDVVWHRCDL